MNNIDKGRDKMSEIEMLDIKSNISPKEYLTKLLDISKHSTKENSIVYDFDIDRNYCHMKVTKYEVDGLKEEEKEQTFDNISEVINDMLTPFLENFAQEDNIVINNITPYKEDTSNLKIISESNDMCNIHGLDEELATKLSEMVGKIKTNTNHTTQQQIDNRGVGNALAFIISLLILGMVILGLLVPNL